MGELDYKSLSVHSPHEWSGYMGEGQGAALTHHKDEGAGTGYPPGIHSLTRCRTHWLQPLCSKAVSSLLTTSHLDLGPQPHVLHLR